jgi:transposase-like protein
MGGEWSSVMPKESGPPVPPASSSEVSQPPAKRRSFSPAEKLRIVREADACTQRGEVEALLRREGIYSSHLAAWRKAILRHGVEGLGAQKPGRKPHPNAGTARRIDQLERKNARLEKELRVAHKLLELQKKVSEILGVTLPPPPPEDE